MPTSTELVTGLAGAIGCDFRTAQNQLIFVEYGGVSSPPWISSQPRPSWLIRPAQCSKARSSSTSTPASRAACRPTPTSSGSR